ncbi:hypothetical protein S40288_02794 [Stachybotrys chartarum IBT 40288]|nr:hypothetical protein S40288_02794 [Stachybotrys chartarum IBT 40288]
MVNVRTSFPKLSAPTCPHIHAKTRSDHLSQPRSGIIQCRLEREFSRLPVTALAIFQDSSEALHVLAALDTDLHVYHAASGHLVCQFRVFDGQPIHGIHLQQYGPNGSRALVWGATRIAYFATEGLRQGAAPALLHADAPDWVYDGKLSPHDDSRAVLATAHNEAVLVLCNGPSGAVELGSPVSPSRPILSSAHLTWLSDDSALVAGGSFFGEILVWKYHVSKESSEAHEMLYVLRGHEGSVFGMHIPDPLFLPDGSPAQLLVSCSDDRTIRVWDITTRDTLGAAARLQLRLNDARETGFTAPSDRETKLEEDRVEPVAVVMGHLSRIWGVKMITPQPGRFHDTITLYSFGEDATVLKWQLLLDITRNEATATRQRLTGALSYQATFSMHDGKNIWSHDVATRPDVTLVATGGADGKVAMVEDHELPPNLGATTPKDKQFPSGEVVILDTTDLVSALPSYQSGRKKTEIISRYDFLEDDQILVSTSSGRIVLGKFKEFIEWRVVTADDSIEADLHNCYVVRATGHGTALIGTTTGNIYFYGPSSGLVRVESLPGRIVEIYCLHKPSSSGSAPPIEALINLYGTSIGHYLTLDPATGTLSTHEEVRGLDERFVTLSAGKVGDYLVIGSRHGWISLTKRIDGLYRSVFVMEPRNKDGITSIRAVPSKEAGSTSSPYFLITGRDGRYRIYQIDERHETIQLRLCHEASPPFGPFIEGAWFTGDDQPQLVLYGFRSKRFVVWNETTRQEIANIDCGGAHRTFVLHHKPGASHSMRLAFTRASKLGLYRQDGAIHSSVQSGVHGREIRTMSVNGRYVATGAEDTTVRLWEYQAAQGANQARFHCRASLKAHNSGLQTVRWLGEDLLFSSGATEEFFVWRIHQLQGSCFELGVVCEGVLTDKSKDQDLRIMDFDVYRTKRDGTIIITMAFSNTTLKTYKYSVDGHFHLIAMGLYTGACLTQVRHLDCGDNAHSAILTAATDGHLALWDLENRDANAAEFVLKQVIKMHQSCIKSLDMAPSPNGYRAITGGDDNALGQAVIIKTSEEAQRPAYRIVSRAILSGAHAAAINGIVLARYDNGEALCLSISNDQKVKAWRVSDDEPGRIHSLADVYSGVADAGCIELIDDGRRAVVAGVGLEVWNVHIGI